VQVDPIKPKLRLPGTQRLILKCDEPFTKLAFKFKLRRYIEVDLWALGVLAFEMLLGRGLHSSTSQLNQNHF